MATKVDPRMINAFKTLIINDGRFLALSAFQSQITFLSAIDINTISLNVVGNTTFNEINSNTINNTGPINTDTVLTNNITVSNTLNSGIINTADLNVSDNTILNNLIATGEVVTNFSIITADNDYVFSDADNSKVIHFDTTTTPEVSAIFPSNLSEGFNVGVVNAGIGVIYLSGEDVINSAGNINSEIYTGFFVYKVNGELFSVGNLE